MQRKTILVVEDDKSTMEIVAKALEEEGFAVLKADTAFKARGQLAKKRPDLVIIDRKLPDGDGLALCREMRQAPAFSQTAVLFLTAKGSTADRVVGLRTGGDDYLPKPFSPEELVARVDAVLRRSGRPDDHTVLECDDLKVDLDARKVLLKQTELVLSPKEFDLLAAFLLRRDRVLTRAFLLQNVWDYEGQSELSDRVVDVTLNHLKEKLGPWGRRITAVRGFGYRLDSK